MEGLRRAVGMLLGVVLSQTFWTAIGAIGAVVALYFIYRQIASATSVTAYEFLRREDDRFRSDEMARHRSELARVLLVSPTNYQEIDDYADYVLDYFEDLGLMARWGIANAYLTWTINAFYVIRYWEALKGYIEWARQEEDDSTYYREFEYLYQTVLRVEHRMRRKGKAEVGPVKIREFLQDELHIKIRHCRASDLDCVLEIEKSSFDSAQAYDREHFEELLATHPGGFYVAEQFDDIVGYIVGYASDGCGEVDSIAVASSCRGLGVGRRLLRLVVDRFSQQGFREIRLETRMTNTPALSFFEASGFRVVEEILDYYGPRKSAYRMQLALGSELGEAAGAATGRAHSARG